MATAAAIPLTSSRRLEEQTGSLPDSKMLLYATMRFHRYAGGKVAAPVKAKDRVLVVEDETLIRMSSADVIRHLGFEVLEAVDADHAVSLLV